MQSKMMISVVSVVVGCVFLLSNGKGASGLKLGFYKATCPHAETIVRTVVHKWFNNDPSIPAALLHLQFHDCFVNGCDASILIDSKPDSPSEKAAGPSQTVRGYDLLDDVKAALEAACPSRVSCADILALATRDAVVLAGGPSYALPTGRLDGLVSKPDDVKLPGPALNISQAFTNFFHPLGFTLKEMVTLLGAHTVGVAHCTSFRDRISDFKGTGKPDPSMDPNLAASLRKTCFSAGGNIKNESNPTAFLDQNTSFAVDASYYRELTEKKGVLTFDQLLETDQSTAGIVSGFARSESDFRRSFAAAMVKMGGLVGGGEGEVRKHCRVFNNVSRTSVAGGGGA